MKKIGDFIAGILGLILFLGIYNYEVVLELVTGENKALQQKAENGDPYAMLELARLHYEGKKGFLASDKMGMYWTERAANLGVPEAHFNLGLAYVRGNNAVSVNYSKAKSYFQTACNLGIEKGCENIQRMKERGMK